MIRRLLLAGNRCAYSLVGCGGSSKPGFPTIQAARTYALVDFSPVRAGRGREAGARLVRDSAARREAAHVVPARPGSAHRRPPDHRPSRPEHDHPPPPADRGATGRSPRPVTFTAARSLPRGRRRLPEHHRAAAELPALRLAAGPGCLHADSLCPPFRSTDVVDGYRITLEQEPEPPRDPGCLPSDHRDRSVRAARAIHAVVRRARARDLLPGRARSTTSTRTSVLRAPPAARASSVPRR